MKPMATTYKLLSLALPYPDASLLSGLRELPLFKDSLKATSLEELQGEHTRIFSLSIAGGISPYETEYGRRDIFMKSQQMADIGGFYRAFGLEIPESAHQRMDYLGAELELMDWLLCKEQNAEAKGKTEQAKTCLDAAKKFLQDHLGTWGPFFAEQLAKASRLPFYRTFGSTLQAFLESECRRLDAHPERILQWEPAVPQEELSCGTCPILPDENHTPDYP